MTQHIPEERSARVDWSRIPPRDPDEEDEEDEDDDDEEEDEPPVVREPDED